MKPLLDQYQELKPKRDSYLARAKTYSRITIPQLLADEYSQRDVSESKARAYTSFGARLVNHLSNKVVMTLFPVGHNFFLPKPSKAMEESMRADGLDPVSLNAQMVALATKGRRESGKILDRQTLIEIAKHLIVAGNCLLYYPKGGKALMIPMTDYVVERDIQDRILRVIWKQSKSYGRLSRKSKAAFARGSNNIPKPSDQVEIYTGAVLQQDGSYLFLQEIKKTRIVEKQLSELDMPFSPLRWSKQVKESYGHSYVEDNSADLMTHRFLRRAMAKGMALMADIKFLVKQGTTNLQRLMEADMGEFVPGDLNDIGVLQLSKYADFTPVAQAISDYERSLGQAFLLNSAVRRDAERVTTYELRLDAAELESTMGGIYSLLAEDWQTPLARVAVTRVDERFKGSLDFDVITGVETLGQSGELDKISSFGQIMAIPAAWPQPLAERVKWDVMAKTVSASLALETPWLMTEDEFGKKMQAQAEAAQQNEINKGMGQAIPAVAGAAIQQQGGK